MKKKIFALVAAASLMVAALTGCGEKKVEVGKITIVTTIFPEYDWVREIIKGHEDKFDVTLLLDSGADLHSYQPTVEDITKVSNADMFVYVGGESDEWVEDALADAVNKDQVSVNLLEVLKDTVKEEEVVEGMQGEEEEEEGEEEGEEVGPEYDEHVWLSVRCAKTLVNDLAAEISAIDEENKADYEKNAADYAAALDEIDAEYAKTLENTDTILFGDRFPFRYMVDDYGIKYYAAFVGCSAETEASFETITFLANKVDELGLKSIFTIESSDGSIANTIIENSKAKDAKVFVLDSMQSVTAADVNNGETYLGVVKSNLDVLKEALAE
ncbi:MAG: zinc ABC transporter substrate-binding protein [Lachnospiraceae bacterium]|nr:zinc ABC transporter substrate-binding protein [Lachnospiraceae bacterium]